MDPLAALTTQVTTTTGVEASAVVLINGLAAQLAAAKNDPAKVQAIIDSLNKSSTSLAAAITANSPPTTPPVPPRAGQEALICPSSPP